MTTISEAVPDDTGAREWMYLATRGIVDDHPGEYDHLSGDVTNAALAEMVFRAADLPLRDVHNPFPDHTDGTIAHYVANALWAGILPKGSPDERPSTAVIYRAIQRGFTISPTYQGAFQRLCNEWRSGTEFDGWITPALDDEIPDYPQPMKRASLAITLTRLLRALPPN